MKHYMVAASALLLGTSALAVAAGADKTDKPMVAPVAAAAIAKPIVDEPAKPELTAGREGPDAASPCSTRPATRRSVDESDGKLDRRGRDRLGDKVDKSDAAGMGGPIEQADAGAIADLTPRPATQNYPPCEPGPGDDNCIQLYEPGVRAQLASWNRPTGGLADGTATSAMGGAVRAGRRGQGRNRFGRRPATTRRQRAGRRDRRCRARRPTTTCRASAARSRPSPAIRPARPGPGDDRCIQLYERGVTGAGN